MRYFFSPRPLKRTLSQYEEIAPDTINELQRSVVPLLGRSIIHVNTSASSGGVAEMLKSQVPLERSMGLDSSWLVMRGTDAFFDITKKMHNLIQGKPGEISDQEWNAYLAHVESTTAEFLAYVRSKHSPIVVIHDPQPLPLARSLPREMPCTWRLHPDLSEPNEKLMQRLQPLAEGMRVVVSHKKFKPFWIQDDYSVIYPAIDPLSKKNVRMSTRKANAIFKACGLDSSRPIISQVARFDPWKDPVGVIEAYRIAKKSIPELQLVLAGLIVAEDDPEAKSLFAEVQKNAAGEKGIYLFGGKKPPGNYSNDEFVGAFQGRSTVVLQKSTKEGFGMSVTEAMWKGTPVIGGNVGGIKLQIENDVSGYVVDTVKECARRIVELVRDPDLRERIGEAGKDSVRSQFLIPRLMKDHVQLYLHAINSTPFSLASLIDFRQYSIR